MAQECPNNYSEGKHVWKYQVLEKRGIKNFWHEVRSPERCYYCHVFREAFEAYQEANR